MPQPLTHSLKFDHSRDSIARQDFVVGLRKYVLNDLSAALRRRYEDEVAPAFERAKGRPFETQDEIHKAMLDNPTFQVYSVVRYNAQEMSWRSILPGLAENLDGVKAKAADLAKEPLGSLTLDPSVPLPKNVTELDVHLMPGGYESRDEMLAGAVYDNGLTVFTAGFLGPEMDDTAMSMAHYVKEKFPDFAPQAILDAGCTIGHNSVPWKQVYPDAEVHAIDVASASVRYGHARAEAMGIPIHFHQMDATSMAFADESMDLVVSAQFLHEISLKDTRKYFAEAFRVLKPGGLLLTMELAPSRYQQVYDRFYLDWDGYYNREPFFRAFREADAIELAGTAGFTAENYFEYTVPQYFKTTPEAFRADVAQPITMQGYSGQLNDHHRYFGFGFWK